MMTVDFRSDTVTKPTPGMLEAMMTAVIGDDVFDEDPTVKKLEAKIAGLFGKEAAIYCPSGTMTNQIALRIHTQPQDEVICDKRSHIYLYEGGGIASNSLISARLVDGDRGRLSPEHVLENINNPDDIHLPLTRLVSLENTMNKGGGAYYTLAQIKAVSDAARSKNLKMHLDGARIFNALVETGDRPEDVGELFDTVSVCFSKGLGAPVGSALVGSHEHIKKAKRVRKVFGGGMRQAGFLAAACIYALDNHVERLKIDHQKAKALGGLIETIPYVTGLLPVDTNIVIFELDKKVLATDMVAKLKEAGILAVPFGKHEVRLVTHLDIKDDMIDYFGQAVGKLKSAF
tara:strand:- start:12761 stop:13795 length:1035 start_codon:yes stop_codon:yes gene_type:complete